MPKGKKPTPFQIRFSSEEEAVLQEAAKLVWQAIGHDMFEANGGEDIPREDVIELVLDANRCEDMLKIMRHKWNKANRTKYRAVAITDGFLDRLQRADYDVLVAAVKPAFQFRMYGA